MRFRGISPTKMRFRMHLVDLQADVWVSECIGLQDFKLVRRYRV